MVPSTLAVCMVNMYEDKKEDYLSMDENGWELSAAIKNKADSLKGAVGGINDAVEIGAMMMAWANLCSGRESRKKRDTEQPEVSVKEHKMDVSHLVDYAKSHDIVTWWINVDQFGLSGVGVKWRTGGSFMGMTEVSGSTSDDLSKYWLRPRDGGCMPAEILEFITMIYAAHEMKDE